MQGRGRFRCERPSGSAVTGVRSERGRTAVTVRRERGPTDEQTKKLRKLKDVIVSQRKPARLVRDHALALTTRQSRVPTPHVRKVGHRSWEHASRHVRSTLRFDGHNRKRAGTCTLPWLPTAAARLCLRGRRFPIRRVDHVGLPILLLVLASSALSRGQLLEAPLDSQLVRLPVVQREPRLEPPLVGFGPAAAALELHVQAEDLPHGIESLAVSAAHTSGFRSVV